MTWSVQLGGHEFDLATLKERYSNGDPKVTLLDDGHLYLQGTALDGASDAPVALEIAKDQVQRLNGAARLERPNHQDVTLTGQIREGENMNAVVRVDTIEARSHVFADRIGGEAAMTSQPDPTPIDRAAKYPAVGEVLNLFGSPDGLTLSNLYKIFEVIRDDMGGGTGLTNSGLSDMKPMSAFTATANRPDVSGTEARHARMSGSPPRTAMTVDEARAYIRDLADRWIQTKPV